MIDPESNELDLSVEYDRETGRYRTQTAWTGEHAPSVAVIELLETATEVDPEEMEPLWNSIDLDALDSLFAPTGNGRPRMSGRVTFRYADFEVTVRDDGEVIGKPIDGSG